MICRIANQLWPHNLRLVHYTRKNAHVVTNLQQTCSNAVPTTSQQDVFAMLVPSSLTIKVYSDRIYFFSLSDRIGFGFYCGELLQYFNKLR